jgi:pimeloyl-ACP methyl ester carboxylesterase
VVALVLGVLAGAIVTSSPASAAQALQWERCGRRLECTTLDVPVDYTQPDGEQVTLKIARQRAGDRRHRVGTLVVNWGGPGDPGTETLRLAGSSFPAEIRERFDIVSFDPRGTGASRPIDCVDDSTFERLLAEDPTPDTPDDLAHFYDGSNSEVDFIQTCVQKFGPWLAAVGTRNVVRDLDRIRAALGEEKLNFLGYSYGTVMGAVYAQLFPERVRTMVLDSAVNLSETLESAQVANLEGFEQALDEFLRDCASDERCGFHSDGDPRRALEQLRDRFEQGLTVATGDGRTAGEATFYAALLGALYDRQTGWPILAAALHQVVDDENGTLLALLADSQTGRRDDGTYDNIRESIGFITCSDRPDALVPFEEYRAAFEQHAKKYPFFGRFVAAYPLGCDPRAPLPEAGTALDDVRTSEAPPAIVIGTTGDPATPYAGARDLRRRLEGSRLLTFESTEHGSYAKGVDCIDDAVDRYLVDRVLPPRGTRCQA